MKSLFLGGFVGPCISDVNAPDSNQENNNVAAVDPRFSFEVERNARQIERCITQRFEDFSIPDPTQVVVEGELRRYLHVVQKPLTLSEIYEKIHHNKHPDRNLLDPSNYSIVTTWDAELNVYSDRRDPTDEEKILIEDKINEIREQPVRLPCGFRLG